MTTDAVGFASITFLTIIFLIGQVHPRQTMIIVLAMLAMIAMILILQSANIRINPCQ